MALITTRELHLFHTRERDLLVYLIYTLGRDPFQSLLTVALWLWLEHVARPNLVPEISLLSPSLINAMANEAFLCIQCLQYSDADDPRSYSVGIPLTATLTHMNLTLLVFNRRRFTVICGIKSILNNVCSRIFTDILSHVYQIPGACSLASLTGPPTPVMVPGFPHAVYGPFMPSRPEWDLTDGRLWYDRSWKPSGDVSDDDKTMFLTFSKGFPVTEEEVWHLFRTVFGEKSVVQIFMGNLLEEECSPQEDALYATLLVDSVATVDWILNGRRLAKYKINGKDIWARKYERRV
ncbi:uncharacterized protein LOC129302096 [Prosopis cineraria]|uniref:uncharacterized protein LOC129302096 n=1 Tax=Prosopis cineraria TaxID=364024 RepID=UPI00240ED62C|nr:uncharacterized protein LOC129302096 [Prosopis cineraria]